MKRVIIMLIIVATFFIRFPSIESAPGNETNVTAGAGNTTWLDFVAAQETAIWQGYFGSVSGGIVLTNGDDESFYDWNLVEAAGEVLATRNLVQDWSTINCTNQTQIYFEEEALNIENASTEGINDTYLNNTHPSFDIAGRLISGCRSTLTDNSTDDQVVFWNVILNSNASNVVYTAIMDDDVIGFNGTISDFQLLVPVDKEAGNSQYWIYVELN